MDNVNPLFDFYDYVLKLTIQIPKGKISTYKNLAIALGDEISARAVGTALNRNPEPIKIPCHRIIYSDGRIGGYKLGVEKKIELLQKEGFVIENKGKKEDARIKDFRSYLFRNFHSNEPLKEMKRIQENLSKKVITEDAIDYSNIIICGADVAYKSINDKEYGFGALMIADKKEKEKEKFKKFSDKMEINFPYIPTYLSFRETPVIIKLINDAIKNGIEKDKILLMVDGNGILHPSGIGIASHIGVVLNIATIGIAKSLLCGEIKDNRIFIKNRLVGEKIGKIYISPGHKISLKTAVYVVKKFLKYNIPEPIRLAHIYANEIKDKGQY